MIKFRTSLILVLWKLELGNYLGFVIWNLRFYFDL